MVTPATRGSGHTDYDVAIVGAGPAGAALATFLARDGWQVIALDRAAFPREKPCAEYLSPPAEPLLARVGALDEVLAGPHGRLRGFRIFAPGGRSFQGDFATATADLATASQSPYATGLTVPRLCLDLALVRAARRAGAEVREGWRLAEVRREAGLWRLTPAGVAASASGATEGHGAVSARLLVGADGVHSVVARRLGLQRPGRLRRVALVAHMRGIAGVRDYAEMHVAHGCYLGVSPLSERPGDDLCNVSVVVDEAREGRALAGRGNAFLLEALARFPAMRGRLGAAHIVRDSLAISRLHVRVTSVVSDGVLLVGDAAGYYDPFTGEGIFRALRGAELAAPTIGAALRSGDVSATRLAPYRAALAQDLRGRHLIEQIVQLLIAVPPLMDHVARVFIQRKRMADTLVGVVGDYLSPSAVLRPGFVLHLAV